MSTIQQIALALAVASAGTGQGLAQDGAGAGRRAAARMEEQAQASMMLLEQARQQYSQGKFREALENYRRSLTALPQAPNMEKRRRFLETSIADASVAVAQEYIKVGRYDEASGLLESALKATPNHALAKRTMAFLKDPVRTNPALSPEHVGNVEEVNRLLHLAFGYYELGQYDEALKEFTAVLRLDPQNTAARRGMEHVNRARTAYFAVARDEARGSALADVDKQWERPVPLLETPEEPSSFSRPLDAPLVNVDQKLGLIRLPRVQLDGASVEEAVDYLRNQARMHDSTALTTAERGVNISLNPGSESSISAKEVASKKVTLNLQNVPLRDALDYVARAAGLVLRTNAYGAELISSSDETSYMLTKTIAVPPGFFSSLSESSSESESSDPFASGDSSSSGMTLKRVDPQKALASLGLKLPEGSFIQYNAGSSTILFHGTPRDLSMLEELVASKSAEQPLQVVVSATFLEVNQTDLEELGFNWIVNLNLDPTKWFMSGAGTDKDGYNNTVLDSAASVAGAASPVGVVGGLRSGNQVFTEDSINGMIERGSSARSSGVAYAPGGAPSIVTMRGIWSQADVTMIMRGLSQKKGTDIMQHPSVIVKPGEKAMFFSGRELIYPTEYDPPEMPNNSNNNSGGGRNPSMPITPAHPSAFETRQLGTIFNVEVTGISDDKAIVEMTVAPEIVEFDGFINYGTPIFVPVIGLNNDKDDISMVKISDNLILQPVFSSRRMTSPVRIATGNTLVIGALKKSTSITYEDKIPVLGDIPWVGRLFRSKGSKEERKAIIIMVKAEVVDPGGKELYTPGNSGPDVPELGPALPALGAAENNL